MAPALPESVQPMISSRRSAIVLSLLGLGAAAAAHAVDPTLQIVSGTSANETRRSVALKTAQYDIATKALIATTRAGNLICNTAQVPGAGVLKLRLDGVAYPVTTSGLPGTLAAPIEYRAPSVTFALGLQGTSGPGECVSSHTTSTGLGLRFPGQRRLPVAEKVFFDLPTRTFEIRVAEPVLCESYVAQGGSSGLAVLLSDSNSPLFNPQTAKLLPGHLAVDYGLGGFDLLPVPQVSGGVERVQCSVPGSNVSVTPGGGSGTTIFSSGFEAQSVLTDPSDVRVTISGIGSGSTGNNLRTTGALPGGPLQFVVRVVNEGTSAAGGVRLREFATGAQAITQSGQPRPAQILAGEPGSSSCVRIGGSGPCPVFDFPISLNLGAMPPGEGYEFTLTRVVVPTASAGDRGQLGFAAFADPLAGGPDANLSNNGAWLTADIISNQAPVISAVPAQTMDEDGGPLLVPFTVTDAEGDPIQQPTATTLDTALFPMGSLVVSGSAGVYSVALTPAPDRNGVATISLSATDGNSAPTVRTFTVTVNAVNDPPRFTLNVPGGEIVATDGVGNCPASPQTCFASAAGFVTGLLPGPPTAVDEAGQTVVPNTVKDQIGAQRLLPDACRPASVDGVAPATFFAGGLLPQVLPVSGSWNLAGQLSRVVGAVDCDITVIDNGEPAAVSAPQTLRIRFQLPPP